MRGRRTRGDYIRGERWVWGCTRGPHEALGAPSTPPAHTDHRRASPRHPPLRHGPAQAQALGEAPPVPQPLRLDPPHPAPRVRAEHHRNRDVPTGREHDNHAPARALPRGPPPRGHIRPPQGPPAVEACHALHRPRRLLPPAHRCLPGLRRHRPRRCRRRRPPHEPQPRRASNARRAPAECELRAQQRRTAGVGVVGEDLRRVAAVAGVGGEAVWPVGRAAVLRAHGGRRARHLPHACRVGHGHRAPHAAELSARRRPQPPEKADRLPRRPRCLHLLRGHVHQLPPGSVARVGQVPQGAPLAPRWRVAANAPRWVLARRREGHHGNRAGGRHLRMRRDRVRRGCSEEGDAGAASAGPPPAARRLPDAVHQGQHAAGDARPGAEPAAAGAPECAAGASRRVVCVLRAHGEGPDGLPRPFVHRRVRCRRSHFRPPRRRRGLRPLHIGAPRLAPFHRVSRVPLPPRTPSSGAGRFAGAASRAPAVCDGTEHLRRRAARIRRGPALRVRGLHLREQALVVRAAVAGRAGELGAAGGRVP